MFAAQLGADALGFIFYEKSPRFIAPQKAAEIAADLPENITRVAVCVRPDLQTIEAIDRIFPFDVVQIHGELSPEYLNTLDRYTVLPAAQIGAGFSDEHLFALKTRSGAVLFDTKKKDRHGGTGEVFDWGLLGNINSDLRIVLAGGLNSDNVLQALEKVNPYAIDLNSGVESRPGIKDHNKLEFIFNLVKDKRSGRQFEQNKSFPFS